MSSLVHVVGAVLAGLGVVVVVAAAIAAVWVREEYVRLHFLTPVTSLGAPLVGVGLGLVNGWTLTSATILGITLLLAITGPVLGSAIGRVTAQLDGVVEQESPE